MEYLDLKGIKPIASVVMLLLWVLVCILGLGLMALPLAALVMPALLCYGALRAGRVTALACVLLAAATAMSLGGGLAAGAIVVLLLPALCYSIYSYDRKLPFWHSALVCACMLLTGAMLCAALATYLAGGDLVGTLRDTLEALLHGMPQGDALLAALYGNGMLTVPEALTGPLAVGESFAMTPAIREELIKQLLTQVESMQRIQMPMQILSGSMLGGLMCVYLPRRYVIKHANDLDTAPLVPLEKWYLPVRVFMPVISALLVVGLIALLSDAAAVRQALYVLFAGIDLVLVLQGVAIVSWFMKKRGTRKGWRMVAVIALYVMQALLFIGFADQLFDFRGLRTPPKDTQDEEDSL